LNVSATARGLAVAVTTTAAATGTIALAAVAAPAPAAAAGSFPDLLALGAAAALAGCAVWAWLSVVAVLVGACTGRVVRGVPAGLRRAVLLLCGLTTLAALAAPATATSSAADPQPDHGTPAGLPYPDRATGPAAPAPPPAPRPEPTTTYTVRPGDSLWSIARATRPEADEAALAREVARLYAVNRAAIGADPDLIRPGQRLATRSPR
jgi:LysM repeat protein